MINFPRHFDGKRFFNPGAAQARGLKDVLQWKLTERAQASPKFIDDVVPAVPPQRATGSDLRLTMVNHSTVLLQWNGMNILTDPVWSERASPFSWIGPRRHRKPGIMRQHVPPIDLILISHNHYDHLDLPTLRWLAQRGASTFIVPLGLGKLLRRERISPVHELDWGQSVCIDSITVHAVPAIHFSARGIADRNSTLWCGYVMQCEGRTVYFAGDTGFSDHFEQIRNAFGPPQLSLLPVGAYLPRWFMAPVHMAPEQALEAHRVLGSITTVAIHHGTFQLADDAPDEADRALLDLGKPPSFLVLKNGESSPISL